MGIPSNHAGGSLSDPGPPRNKTGVIAALQRFFDGSASAGTHDETSQRIDWVRVLPFFGLHLSCLGVLWVGWSPVAVAVAIALYFVRMFAITAFYHRYFSHRTFRTSRVVQFLGAVLGNSSGQRGPLWWAAHHRDHHRHSDQPEDKHSPEQHGFWWSHVFWFTSRSNFRTREELVKDLVKFPELRFLDRFDWVVPLALASGLYVLGFALETWAPSLGTTGPQLFIWGFCISTVVVFHATCTINSLGHQLGSQRYETGDQSRNNFFLALLTLGEGWHNNHHHYPASARQGFYWWEVDLTYYALRTMSWLGIVRQLRPVPARRREEVARASRPRPLHQDGLP